MSVSVGNNSMRVAYLQSWCALRRSACLSQVTTGVGCTWLYTPWMPIKGSNTRVRSHSYLYAFCLLLPLGYVGSE